ncbi:hypothetical protein ACLHZ7_17415, partial [Aeromonas salmonicida]|uniref:hypothetical protein n=1 Tax=Aeromonas salmonicida TaxID=645 RepID=UPI003D070D25
LATNQIAQTGLSSLPPVIYYSEQLFRRLEPRSSVTIYGIQPEAKNPENPLKCAYARTECGVTQTGTSPVFKKLAQEQV